MKALALALLIFTLALPARAADTSTTQTSTTAEKAKDEKKEDAKTPARDKEDSKKTAKSDTGEEGGEETKDPNVFECKYYTVKLVPGWSAVTPPTENQGTVTAVFKSTNGGIAIMMVLGKLGGADTKTIADMFAEQFKAEKPPVAKNGQYTFTFMRDGSPCDAYVSSHDDIFMITTISGNRKEALNFIKNQVKSEEYAKLLPQ